MVPLCRPGLSASILCLAALLAAGPPAARADDGSRTPWTTSKVAGPPDPPLPFAVEPAFPNLKLDRPVALAQPPVGDRLFVAEVGGKVVAFPADPGASRAEVAIDLAKARPE